jgi:hypothetical protein
MFEKLAKFRPLPSRRQAPRPRQIAPANDNRPGACEHGVRRGQRPRLVCRWSLIEGTNRLACHWEVDSSDGPDRALCGDPRAGAAFHKSFLGLSYQRSFGGAARLAGGPWPVGKPQAPPGESFHVLHARHSPVPSNGGAGSPFLQLQAARRELCSSSMGFPDGSAG